MVALSSPIAGVLIEGKETGEAIGDAIRLAIAACPVTGSVATPAV